MREEIITLIETATNATTKLENYMFENQKELYTYTKGNIDILKDHINNIKLNLDKLNEESLTKARNDIQLIIDTINKAASGELNQEQPNIETPITTDEFVENNLEFSEDELKKLLEALDNVNFETILPDINDTSVEMPSLDALVERTEEVTSTATPAEFPDFSSLENAAANIETPIEQPVFVEQPMVQPQTTEPQIVTQETVPFITPEVAPIMSQPTINETVIEQQVAPQVQPVQQETYVQPQVFEQPLPTQFVDSSDDNFRI